MFSVWIRTTLQDWQRVGNANTREGAELIEDKYKDDWETVILPKGQVPHPGHSKV